MSNLFDQFASTAARFPDRCAVEVQRAATLERYTYAQLDRMSDAIAGWLDGRGIGRHDRCVLLGENDAHWCAAYFAILRLGAVAVPFDTAYTAPQLSALLADSGARFVFTTCRHLQTVKTALAGGSIEAELALMRGRAEGVVSIDALFEGGAAQPHARASVSQPDDPAVILYTSGTTSDPKGVVLTHGNLLAEREAAFRVVTIDEHDAVLSVLPLFHALAQLANLLLPLTVGARVVFLETVNSAELMRALRERAITAFCCVPQFYYLIHERVTKEMARRGVVTQWFFKAFIAANGRSRRVGLNLGPWLFRRVHAALGGRMRLLVTGGSRFDPVIGRDLYAMGFNILQAYGLTECSGAATCTRPGDPHVESVGQPLPGVDIRILDPQTTAAGPTEGEVAIRGPIVMSGYYRRDDANRETLVDGWLHTGDLGFLDGSGRLHVSGRKKEVIVLASGKNIYPEEIERHYEQSPYVSELCVLGVSRPGDPAAERLHAVVVPNLDLMRERRVVNTREVLRFEIEGLSISLPHHKRILGFDISLDPLPRTTTGKLKRFEIQQRFGDGRTRQRDAPEATWTDADVAWAGDAHAERALAAIRRAIRRDADVWPDANLELDLGLDSMERVELITELEAVCGSELSEEVAQRIYTVRDLVDALRPRDTPAAPCASDGDAWRRLLAPSPEQDAPFTELLRPRPVPLALLYVAVRAMCAVARVTVGVETSTRAHLPDGEPFILSPNHQSYLDPLLLVGALPFRSFRRLFFVGASEYFATPFMQRVARAINVVPVDPDANLVRAMQAGAFGLRHGKVLVLFPEGERSIDGEPKRFKKGAAILSMQLGVPIVPVAIDGVFDVWPRNRPFRWTALLPARRARVRLEFGEPLRPAPADADGYAAATAALREKVVEMWEGLRVREAKDQG